jgi:hypothetical protein
VTYANCDNQPVVTWKSVDAIGNITSRLDCSITAGVSHSGYLLLLTCLIRVDNVNRASADTRALGTSDTPCP